MYSARPNTGNWVHSAACRDKDPELFFLVGTTGPALTQIVEAKAVCARCPVMEVLSRVGAEARHGWRLGWSDGR